MQRLPVFFYGTLRPGGSNFGWALAGRIDGHVAATLHGAAMFAGPGFPFVTDDVDSVVVGDLVTITDGVYGDVLADLDRLEGFHSDGRHNLYDRVVRTVTTHGRSVKAWVYLAGRTERFGSRVVSGDWHDRAGTDRVA